MGVLGGGALDVDAGPDAVGGLHPVVAAHAQPALPVREALPGEVAEQLGRLGGPVPGGQHHCVAVEGEGLSRGEGTHHGPGPVGEFLHGGQGGRVQDAQPFGAGDLLLVDGPVQLLDQITVHHRVVGVGVVADELLLDLLRGAEELVDGGRVEDPVGERAVVGRAVPVPGEHGADLGVREGAVQVVGGLGGGLSGADDDEPAMGADRQFRCAVQQVAVVPDVRAGADPVRDAGAQPGPEYEVAGAGGALRPGPGRGAGDDVQLVRGAGRTCRAYLDGLGGVVDQSTEGGGAPAEVVVEFEAGGEEGLLVDEVGQPVPVVQVVQEAEGTPRIAHRHQVLQEGDLHGGPFEEHALVPSEVVLALDERGPDHLAGGASAVVLPDRYRQGEVGRPEADAHQVPDVREGVPGCGARVRCGHAHPSSVLPHVVR